MNVLFTIALFAVVAMWALAVYGRLARLRSGVTQAWELLQADPSHAAAQKVYNARVDTYNAALEAFPAIWIGSLAGFKPARKFE